MKKIITFLSLALLCLMLSVNSLAENSEVTEEATRDNSTPRLMITEYSLEGDYLSPGKTSLLTVTIKNFSNTKYAKNIKLSFGSDMAAIKPVGTGNQYVDIIYAGSSYKWKLELTAAQTAEVGEHQITISAEYEDIYFNTYSSNDNLRLNVRQTVGLDFSNAQLPTKIFAEDTATISISLLNTGKARLRNIKLNFEIDKLTTGGTYFVGEIAAGETAVATVNLRAGGELGAAEGKLIISYEDEFAQVYTKEQSLSSTIIEKPSMPVVNEEPKSKYPLWWAFALGGLILGGSVGCIIPISIAKSAQRRQDDLRL